MGHALDKPDGPPVAIKEMSKAKYVAVLRAFSLGASDVIADLLSRIAESFRNQNNDVLRHVADFARLPNETVARSDENSHAFIFSRIRAPWHVTVIFFKKNRGFFPPALPLPLHPPALGSARPT